MIKLFKKILTLKFLEDRKSLERKDIPKNLPILPEESLAKLKIITRKPIYPTDKELEENNRSRSAKLRIAEVQMKE